MPINTQTKEDLRTSKRVLFVDGGVSDTEHLLNGISTDTAVIHLEEGKAPLDQIAAALKDVSGPQEVHLLAHGEPGAIALAGTHIDTAALDANAESLSLIKNALGQGAKLALWACSVAAEELGRTFTKALEAATGARVFAADGLIGTSAKGGSWDIGTASPFSEAAMASYSHTLPTFDGDGGSVDGNQTYTEADNGDGITLTVVFEDDVAGGSTATASIIAAGGLGGSTGNVFFNLFADETQTVTVTFSSAVDVTSFIYLEADANETGTYTFTPTGGSGTPVVVAAGAFTNTNGTLVTPGDWEGVTGYTVTNSGGAFSPGFDNIIYTVHVADSSPVIDRTPVNEVGTDGSDVITGKGGDDTLIGGAGDDVVYGAQGNDLIWAGAGDEGNDTIDAGTGDDTVGGGKGDDFIEGGDGSDILLGGSGDDRIYVTEKNNENGDLSDNIAWGGAGNDRIFGGLGTDTLGGGNGKDTLEGGGGGDVMFGGACNDELSGDAGHDTIYGGSGDDVINGGGGNDLLFNGSGDDIVSGGQGSDTLWGGAGDDTLTGGNGADSFGFTATSGNDRISDFDVDEDVLNISQLGFADDFDLADVASDVTDGDTSGLLLQLSDGTSVFLVGLSTTDVADIDFLV